jgi:heterodisulfide reductase subunit A
LEKHPKLAPVETASDGIFIAGACQGPKDIPDTVAQAGAAAAMALSMMDMGKWTLEPSIAQVDVERCSGCGECVLACPYTAIELVEGRAQVSETLCKGCGICVGHCLPKAIRLLHFTDEQLVAEMQGALSEEVA